MKRLLLVTLAGFLAAVSCPWRACAQPDRSGAIDFFERQVRPLLVAHCISCHGSNKQESDLRLDSRSAILAGGARGPAARKGHPDTSLLMLAVQHRDDLQMPPNGQLKQREIKALARWIEMGLPWPVQDTAPQNAEEALIRAHWAFQPVTPPTLPEVRHDGWALTAVDRFILAQLERHGLQPSRPADRRTLIRRVTLDLIGIPPTVDEVNAFLSDSSPDAFAKVVDRLLASPQYGARWGRHWLDVARYADNKGYVFFEEKNYPWAYTYRDYVIEAFNRDLPYDRFVLEQLAADLLPQDPPGEGQHRRALRGLGFLTLGGHFMNNTHDIIDDRIDVISRGLLGLTVTCARCHDHKFDPIPQADYYSLYGVLRSCQEPTVPPLIDPPPENEQYQKFAAELLTREQKLQDFVRRKHSELAVSARTRIAEYLLAAQAARGQPKTDDFMLLVDKGDLNPTMILRWRIYLESTATRHRAVWAHWNAYAQIQGDFAEQAAVVSQRLSGASSQDVNPLVQQEFAGGTPGSLEEVAQRYQRLLRAVDQRWQTALQAAAAPQHTPPRQLEDPHQEALRQVLYGPHAPPDVPLILGWGFLALLPDRPTQDEYKKLLKAVESWSTTAPAAPPRAMVLLDAERPFQPYVFLRGNPNRRGPMVPRQFLGIATANRQPFTRGSGRLELAQAIVDDSNPFTARVLVNRLWLHHFGRGLVTTPSDFGTRSDPPSHPELLDYLARRLVASGWSIKSMHQLILNSAVYQQASERWKAGQRIDPENRLWWRADRRRLDFEAMRDSMLAVAGSLDQQLGGPPVDVLGQFSSRRTVFGFIDRMDPSSLLTTFDFPNPASTSPQRSSTTVAPQALFLMNHAFPRETAQRLLQRPDFSGIASTPDRIRFLYLCLFSREPSGAERTAAEEFLGSTPDQATWIQYVQALMMTNEFVFVD